MNPEEKKRIAIENLKKAHLATEEKKKQLERVRVEKQALLEEQQRQAAIQLQQEEQKVTPLPTEPEPLVNPLKRERPIFRPRRYWYEEPEVPSPPEKKVKVEDAPEEKPPVETPPAAPVGGLLPTGSLVDAGIKIGTALALYFISTGTATFAQRLGRRTSAPQRAAPTSDMDLYYRDY